MKKDKNKIESSLIEWDEKIEKIKTKMKKADVNFKGEYGEILDKLIQEKRELETMASKK